MICYDAVAFTSPGDHSINEDAVEIIRQNGQFVAIVADGLGSHGGGNIASSVSIAAIKSVLPDSNIYSEATLNQCLDAANIAVLAQQTPGVPMKSTVVMLAVENRRAAFAHVGDSRGYFFRNGRVTSQTMDHSVSQMAVLRGDITLAQIRFHKKRNQLLRALGADVKANGEVTPLYPLQDSDAFLLCTDGFWEYVTELEMEADLFKSSTATVWLSYMLARVGARVSEKHDNLSAIAIICGGLA